MSKTSIGARRHMQELSDFFHDINEVSNFVVEEFIESRRNKKFLKQSLKRLINKGYIEEKNGKLKKTKSGNMFFKKRFPNIYTEEVKAGNKWYVLSFDIPVNENQKRNSLRYLLKKYNFYQLQESVWIGSHKLSQDIWEFIVENGMKNYCFPMIVDIAEGEERLLEKIRKIKK
jgi:DNA-binding transcriptional regulator PaaX